MVPRDIKAEMLAASREYPIVTLFGPRQSGETTLVQAAFPGKLYRSLEDPDVRRAAELDNRLCHPAGTEVWKLAGGSLR
jgi:predicted AAA+ superfamily ATPase